MLARSRFELLSCYVCRLGSEFAGVFHPPNILVMFSMNPVQTRCAECKEI